MSLGISTEIEWMVGCKRIRCFTRTHDRVRTGSCVEGRELGGLVLVQVNPLIAFGSQNRPCGGEDGYAATEGRATDEYRETTPSPALAGGKLFS